VAAIYALHNYNKHLSMKNVIAPQLRDLWDRLSEDDIKRRKEESVKQKVTTETIQIYNSFQIEDKKRKEDEERQQIEATEASALDDLPQLYMDQETRSQLENVLRNIEKENLLEFNKDIESWSNNLFVQSKQNEIGESSTLISINYSVLEELVSFGFTRKQVFLIYERFLVLSIYF
jgi:hypothetical protein